MIDIEDARRTAEALFAAAAAVPVPVRQLRYELRRRAREWARAVKEVESADEDEPLVVEFLGSVTPGMEVLTSSGWAMIVRRLDGGGQNSLHIEDESGRPTYLNFAGPSSPVAVRI